VGADESVSLVLFRSALDLARNRGLIDDTVGRDAWAAEIDRLRAIAEQVATLASETDA
jgi:glycerol-3-phosphate O-acyltransferase